MQDINIKKPLACFHYVVWFWKRALFSIFICAMRREAYVMMMLLLVMNLLSFLWVCLVRPYKTTVNNRCAIWMELCTLVLTMIMYPMVYKWTPQDEIILFSQVNFGLIFAMLLVMMVILLFYHCWRVGIQKEEFIEPLPFVPVKAPTGPGLNSGPGKQIKRQPKKGTFIKVQTEGGDEGGESERTSQLDPEELKEIQSDSEVASVKSEEEKKVQEDDDDYQIVSADVDLRQGDVRHDKNLAKVKPDEDTGATFFDNDETAFGLETKPKEPPRGKWKQI